jgi:integrase
MTVIPVRVPRDLAPPTELSLPPGITRRKGREGYIVRLSVGTDAGGKRVRHHYTCATLAEAKAKLKEITRRKDDGDKTVLSRESMGQWFEEYTTRWCVEKAPRTRRDLRTQFDLRVPPVLRAVKLRSLTPSLMQEWVTGMVELGLSPRSVAMAHAVVRASLNVAVRLGKLSVNPAAACKLPQRRHVERPRLTREDAQRFLRTAESDPLHTFFVLALATACRPAELFGLRWGDLRDDVLTVRRSVVLDDAGLKTFADTKTHAVRQIPLAPLTLVALKKHRLHLGQPGDDALMFPNATGGALDGRNVVNRHLKPLLKKAGLPGALRLYDLRHSALSILADAGEDPKVVQEIAGHSRISTTYDNYIHPRLEQKRRASRHLDFAPAAASA